MCGRSLWPLLFANKCTSVFFSFLITSILDKENANGTFALYHLNRTIGIALAVAKQLQSLSNEPAYTFVFT